MQRSLHAQQQRNAREVLGRVHVRAGGFGRIGHADFHAVLQGAQLLEFFHQFQRAGRQQRQAPQRCNAIGIQADVPARRPEAALAGQSRRRRIASPGNRRPAEIQRATGGIGHDLDRIRDP